MKISRVAYKSYSAFFDGKIAKYRRGVFLKAKIWYNRFFRVETKQKYKIGGERNAER